LHRERRKYLWDRHSLEEGNAQNVEDVAETPGELELLLQDGHQDVDTDGDPHLDLHHVHRGPVERLDAQVLLDSLEEQLDLPPTLVELGDLEGREREVVREEHEPLPRVEIDIADPAHRVGVPGRRLGATERDGLVAAQAGGLVHRPRHSAGVVEAALAPDHEERQTLRQRVQPPEVGVAAIEDVKGPGLHHEGIEERDIRYLPVGNRDEARDLGPQVEQGMELHGLWSAKTPSALPLCFLFG